MPHKPPELLEKDTLVFVAALCPLKSGELVESNYQNIIFYSLADQKISFVVYDVLAFIAVEDGHVWALR